MKRILHDARNAERILQMTADSLILMEKNGVCVDISTHSNQWFLQAEILLGKNLFELLPEHTFQKIRPVFQEVISERKCISHNYRIDLSDGTYYFKCIMYPYDDMVLCQYRDITERSNVKLQLEQANKERLRYESQIKRLNRIMDTTMKNLPASIVVKDINNDFRYIYCNRKLCDQPIGAEQVIGKNDFDFHPTAQAEMKRKEDMEIAQTGKEIHRTVETMDENGNLQIVDKRKIKVESKDFSPIIISIEWDITQLELIKRELEAEKNKAETSDHLKSAFLANMSHEIRTPLNAIVGFSRIISESDDADERKLYYEIVDANNERLLQLINEILDLSKIESGIVEFTIAPIRLHWMCKEIHDAHVFRCPKGVELRFEPSDETLIIDSDKNRVFQVLSNLIGNAFKFTTEGSISYGYRQEGDYIVFHVTDMGFGIQPDKVDKVFERFVKVNNFAQGTGLGLSICKTIIERLGGEISVTSELGKGSTFTFTLPARKEQPKTVTGEVPSSWGANGCAAQPEAGSPNSARTEAGRANGQATILIAEDTDSNYELLKAILGREYHLKRALDGMEAVTLFNEVRPDLILMDIKMPNLDGLEATKIIRELSATVPIIAQSAYAFEHDRKMAEEAGCNDFIAKPIAQKKLKEMIKKYVLPARGGAIQVGTD